MINLNRLTAPPHRTWTTPMPGASPEPSNPLFELSERMAHGPVKLSEILKVVQQIHDCEGAPHKT